MGRNTKFDQEFLDKVTYMARDGYTDEQIYNSLGIASSTFYNWKNKYPEFAEALRKNKQYFDYKVEDALIKSALGYEYEETEVIASSDGKNPRVKKTKKQAHPNVTALIFWLKNRSPEKWNNREQNNTGENELINSISAAIDKARKDYTNGIE
jgi:hypothetical protein